MSRILLEGRTFPRTISDGEAEEVGINTLYPLGPFTFQSLEELYWRALTLKTTITARIAGVRTVPSNFDPSVTHADGWEVQLGTKEASASRSDDIRGIAVSAALIGTAIEVSAVGGYSFAIPVFVPDPDLEGTVIYDHSEAMSDDVLAAVALSPHPTAPVLLVDGAYWLPVQVLVTVYGTGAPGGAPTMIAATRQETVAGLLPDGTPRPSVTATILGVEVTLYVGYGDSWAPEIIDGLEATELELAIELTEWLEDRDAAGEHPLWMKGAGGKTYAWPPI